MKSYLLLFFILVFNIKGYGQDVETYIDENVAMSQCLMRTYNIPASIILSVAIHESAAGSSKIAKHLNNHFGIKGKNSSTSIKSAYKDFDTIEDAYRHFIEYLITKPKYANLFNTLAINDYKAWARGIHKGGYAASKSWSSQIINTINKYELHRFDDVVEGPHPGLQPVEVENISDIYIVKKNDNLTLIAKKLGATVEDLKRKNKLKSNLLQPGQKLNY